MPNDVKLQEGHPVDENLRPIKVGGKSTAIETAQHGNGARVNGDLEVTGDIKGNIKDMVLEDVTLDSLTTNSIVSTNLTIDDSHDITLDAGGGDVNILQADLNIPIDKGLFTWHNGGTSILHGDNCIIDPLILIQTFQCLLCYINLLFHHEIMKNYYLTYQKN